MPKPLFEVRPSEIHGSGVFATCDVYEGEEFKVEGQVVPDRKSSGTYTIDWGGLCFEPDMPFKNLNHSGCPNAELIYDEDGVYVRITEDVEANCEVTVDYGYDVN